MPKNTPTLIALSFIAALLLAAGAFFAVTYLQPEQKLEIGGYYLEPTQTVPPFILAGSEGEDFTNDDLIGQWTFIYFGYTFCPDACPLALTHLRQMQTSLPPELAAAMNVRLISVDPKRDTPKRLAEYTAYFNADYRGASGDMDTLRTLTKALGIYFAYPEGTDGDTYLVDHSSVMLLINPEGRLQAVFTPPQDPQQLAQDFTAIVAHHGQ